MSEKIEYQEITIKGSLEEYIVDVMEYPFEQLQILYIKFIVYKKQFNKVIDEYDHIPIKFLTVQPQDVLSRTHDYTSSEEKKLIESSDIAIKQREEYQKAVEEEIARRSREIPPKNLQDDDSLIKDNEGYIDPDFKTKIDQNDPNYL